MTGNVSDWLSYAGIALIKVTGSVGSTVYEAKKANSNSFPQTVREWNIPPTSVTEATSFEGFRQPLSTALPVQ